VDFSVTCVPQGIKAACPGCDCAGEGECDEGSEGDEEDGYDEDAEE